MLNERIKNNLTRLLDSKGFSVDARELLERMIVAADNDVCAKTDFEQLLMNILPGSHDISFKELWFCFNDTNLALLPLDYANHRQVFGVEDVVYYIPEKDVFIQLRRSLSADHAFWLRTVDMDDLMRAQKLLPDYPDDLNDLFFVAFDITEKHLFVFDDDFEEGTEQEFLDAYEEFCTLLRDRTPIFVEMSNVSESEPTPGSFVRCIWGDDAKWLTANQAPAFFQEFAEKRGLVPKIADRN